ncbi:MAG: beta-N-acetylglucosaminidase domain-containing protein [Coriobacteriaceae bacterium]|nr:beta-N-acetylglucosaminidase domain-containing protein [Coriobacteriaceae bacterium]
MKCRRLAGLGALSLAIAAAVSGVGANSAYAATTPEVLPVPKTATYQGEALVLSQVELVGTDVADADAVREVKELLDRAGVQVTERTAAQGATSGATAIYLTESDDVCSARDAAAQAMGLANAGELDEEGYVLGVDAASKTIVLTGAGGDGSYYAVQTLAQLIDGKEVPGARIADEPALPVRGTIEGFYARGQEDWSWEDRMEQVRFYGETKMNTYIYAPKEDPYHREQWREPYPADQMAKMVALVKEAKANKVDFVFALSPGNSIDLTSESDFQALVNKCKIMYDNGVRDFAIFFDDIENKDGAGQAKVLNRFNKEFIKAQDEPCTLATVPTEYDSNAMLDGANTKPYTAAFSQNLDADIEVLWTGSSVVPDGITAADGEFINSVYGDRAGIWWNYPCNDYQLDKLAMGPIHGIDKSVFGSIGYFVMNPMGRANLSRVTLATGADFSWNLEAYDEDASLAASCALSYPELAEHVRTLALHSSQIFGGSFSCGRPDAPEAKAHADALLRSVVVSEDPQQDENVVALRADFKAMVDASAALKGGDFDAISAFVNKLGQVAQAGYKAIDLVIAKVNGDQAAVDSLTAELNNTLPSLERGKLVSERSMVYFIKDAIAYEIEPKAGFEVTSTLVQKGTEITLRNTSSTSAAEYEWSFPGAVKDSSTEAEPTVVYTKPGRYDITLTVRNRFGEDTVTQKSAVYVVEAMPETMENLALHKDATASSAAAPTESAEKAVDGLVTGSKWCAVGNGGQWLTVDLKDAYTLSSFRIQHAAAGGEGASANTYSFTISVSTDGRNFTKVIDVTDNTLGVSEHAITPTLGRYVKLDIRTAVSPGTQWPAARIFEFEAYGIADDVSKLPEYVAPDTAKLEALLEDVAALNESDYSTASWGALVAARDAATELLARGDKTQDEVDAAYKELAAKRDALVNVTELVAALDKVAGLVESDYTAESWAAFAAARIEAQALLDGGNATPDQVKAAVEKLEKAVAELKAPSTDPDKPVGPDKPVVPEGPDGDNKPGDNKPGNKPNGQDGNAVLPNTGDAAMLAVAGTAVMGAAAAMAGAQMRRRQR